MTTELVHIPAAQLSREQLDYIKGTDFVPKAYRGNLPAILAAVVTGREYGLGDMESLRLINVIDGRPELNAEGKVKLARRAGHSITGEVTGDKAIVRGVRRDTGDEMTLTYSLEDAKLAGLLDKPNWKRHPKEMLWARAVTILCRRLFGDVVLDLPDVYEHASIEEAEDEASLMAATDLPPVAAIESEGASLTLESTGPEPSFVEPDAPSGTSGAGDISGISGLMPPAPDDLGSVVITEGANEGKTLAEAAGAARGMSWLKWCAEKGDHPQSADAAAYLSEIAE